MNPSSYSQLALESKIRDYAESLRGFVLYHGDELCNNKILDIRVPLDLQLSETMKCLV